MDRQTALKSYLTEKGIKVVWLAKELGLARPYLSEIINGWGSEGMVKTWGPRIAEILGEPVAALFPEYDWNDHSEVA